LSPASETAEEAKQTGTTLSCRVEVVSDTESESGSGAVSASVLCTELDNEDGSDKLIEETVHDDSARSQFHSSSATRLLRGQSSGVESDSEASEKKMLPERRRRSSISTESSHSAEVSPKRQKYLSEGEDDDDAEDSAAYIQMPL